MGTTHVPCPHVPRRPFFPMHNLKQISQIPPYRWPNHPSLLSPSLLVLMWTDMWLFAPALKLVAGACISRGYLTDRFMGSFWKFVCPLPPSRDMYSKLVFLCRSDLLGSLAISLCNWSSSRSIDQLWQGAICTTVQIFHKLHLSWRRPQKCLPSIWKELARTLISALTGNPNGRVLLLTSINRAPLTSFDVGGHLARRGLLWSLLRLIRGPGNRLITHWPTSQAPFSLKRERNLAQLGRYYAPNITPS